jgi:hypothetical protein
MCLSAVLRCPLRKIQLRTHQEKRQGQFPARQVRSVTAGGSRTTHHWTVYPHLPLCLIQHLSISPRKPSSRSLRVHRLAHHVQQPIHHFSLLPSFILELSFYLESFFVVRHLKPVISAVCLISDCPSLSLHFLAAVVLVSGPSTNPSAR